MDHNEKPHTLKFNHISTGKTCHTPVSALVALAAKYQITPTRIAKLSKDGTRQPWPEEVELQKKLWGSVAALRKTADLIRRTGLTIWAWLWNAESPSERYFGDRQQH